MKEQTSKVKIDIDVDGDGKTDFSFNVKLTVGLAGAAVTSFITACHFLL